MSTVGIVGSTQLNLNVTAKLLVFDHILGFDMGGPTHNFKGAVTCTKMKITYEVLFETET